MLFNSYIFIFLFLPLTIIGYFTLNHFKKYKFAQLYLVIMSLWFYAYFNLSYLFIILFSILLNYSLYYLMNKYEKLKKLFLIIGLIINIGSLIYFKYMDFFISNINSLFNTNFNLLHILLPLGISFFTFQQLSFVIDSYKSEVPKYSLLHYASFVSFFPQLIAGPIVTHDELVPQFLDKKKKKLNYDNLSKGIYVFSMGLAKKVILADTFGIAVNWGYNNISSLDSTNAILIMLAYTMQIYFDFSGYSDMAIGIGKMFNIDLPQNFNSPYKALTINDFWKRWHMTLTRFFTKYIYIPLGGNKNGKLKTYINIMIVFMVSGFWHGANWTFIIWGILHGLFSVISRCFKKQLDQLHPALNTFISFSFVNITWIIFRAESIRDALRIIYRIFSFNFSYINESITSAFKLPFTNMLIENFKVDLYFPHIMLFLFFSTALFIIFGCKNVQEKEANFKPTVAKLIWTVLLLVYCVISLSGISTFLYFNF